MRDEEIFLDAFGAFFALGPTPGCAEPPLDRLSSAQTEAATVNTIEEYRRAAEAGNRPAQEMLGLMYLYGSRLYGKGVTRDLRQAAHWLELAAAQGSMLARQLLRRYVLGQTDRGLDAAMAGPGDCGPPEFGAPA